MSHPPTTSKTNGSTERGPFGELHFLAVSRCPDNGFQKDALMSDRPNVWATLRRHLQSLIDAGTDQERYDEVLMTFVIAAMAMYPRGAEPKETLAEVLALDEAAEGMEDVAEIDAMAEPSPARLQRLFRHMSASATTKRRGLRVIARDFRKAIAPAVR